MFAFLKSLFYSPSVDGIVADIKAKVDALRDLQAAAEAEAHNLREEAQALREEADVSEREAVRAGRLAGKFAAFIS